MMVRKLVVVLVLSLSFVPTIWAQSTYSPNSFSPYTMFGLGDMLSPTPASQRAMGGAGVAMRPNVKIGQGGSNVEINYLNPAANAFIPQRSALFSIGGIWRTYVGKSYSTDYNGNKVPATGARNSFSVNDIGMAFPLARNIGLSLSLTPTSVVGYRITTIGNDKEITETIGRALYTYSGEGGISEAKVSLGARILKNFSIGGTFGYYFGNIERMNQANMDQFLGEKTYRFIDGKETIHVSELFYEAGFIYTFRLSKDGYLNIGGTYRSASSMKAKKISEQYITDGSQAVDTLTVSSTKMDIKIPSRYSFGAFYNNTKFSIALDYEYQDFKGAFDTDEAHTGYSLSAQNQIRVGFAYTPDADDLYEGMKRWTYKAGLKYGSTYLVKDGYQLKSTSVTIGADIPLRRGTMNKLTIALELGQRGKRSETQVAETFFKFNFGFKFFGDDMWFYKRKFY